MDGTLHHIEINVSDLNYSIQFWEWFLLQLGYEKFQQWNSGISFKLGDSYIVFVQAEEKYLKNSYHRKNVGLNHIAFQVETRESIDTITRELKAREVKILYEDKHPFAGGKDYYAVYFEDPDRIKIEVVAS